MQAKENIQQSIKFNFSPVPLYTSDFVSKNHGVIFVLPEPICKLNPSSN